MDPVHETKMLAESHALEFKDCGGGHLQIAGNGVLVNYYPFSKRRTVFCPETGRRETRCSPWNAVRLCLTSGKKGIKPKIKPGAKPAVNLDPVHTNPAGIRWFYHGEKPPWDESLGDFISAHSDNLRVEAYHLMVEADQQDHIEG